MSSVEEREDLQVSTEEVWDEDTERRIQENIDIIIDFMAVASIMWSYGNPDVALEVATCARVALDKILEACRGLRTSTLEEGLPWDFIKLLGSLGGEALGEITYWAAKARCSQALTPDAKEVLLEFLEFVGVGAKPNETEVLGDLVLEYLSKAMNRTIASLVVSARRVQ